MTAVMVTAGPTREYLDEVRFLSNGSSGQMGYAIAEAAAAAGCTVDLVSGPTHLPTPEGVCRHDVVSAEEMLRCCQRMFASTDVLFAVAAVSDYRPAQRAAGKPPKGEAGLTLDLVPNPDVVATLATDRRPDQVLVGFALEDRGDADAALGRARAKLERKHLDMIALNHLDAMESDSSLLTLISADQGVRELAPMPKGESARTLVEHALALWSARRGGES